MGQLSRHTKTHKTYATIKSGDIVLIASDNQKRIDWPLTRVTEVIAGKDGVSRVVRIRTAAGDLVRPLQRLVILESPLQETTPSDGESPVQEAIPSDGEDDAMSTEKQVQDDNAYYKGEKHEEIEDPQPTRSRSGRIIKFPKRFS